MRLRVTTAAMRWIDKAGGFDSYIYHTPDRKLASELGMALKRRMHEKVAQSEGQLQPPPLVKRYPRPPRSWQGGVARGSETTDARTGTLSQ